MTFFKSKCSKQPDVGVLTVTALWIFPGGRGGREKYKPPLSTFPSDYQSSNDPNKHGGSGGGGWWWAVVLIVLNARRLRSHLLLTTKVNSHGSSSKRRRRPSALVLVCLRCWEGLQRQRMDPAQSRAVQSLAKTISLTARCPSRRTRRVYMHHWHHFTDILQFHAISTMHAYNDMGAWVEVSSGFETSGWTAGSTASTLATSSWYSPSTTVIATVLLLLCLALNMMHHDASNRNNDWQWEPRPWQTNPPACRRVLRTLLVRSLCCLFCFCLRLDFPVGSGFASSNLNPPPSPVFLGLTLSGHSMSTEHSLHTLSRLKREI